MTEYRPDDIVISRPIKKIVQDTISAVTDTKEQTVWLCITEDDDDDEKPCSCVLIQKTQLPEVIQFLQQQLDTLEKETT